MPSNNQERKIPQTLKSDRLSLSFPMLYEGMDVSHHVRWLNDPQIVEFSEQRHLTHTDKTQYEYIMSFVNTDDLFWEIFFDGKPVGTITAYRNMPNKTANMGVLIGDKRHWGRGFASEAWETVGEYLFEGGTRKLEAGCMGSNRAMISVLKKNKFKLEATIPEHFLRYGLPEDKLLYGKYREAKVFPLPKPKAEADKWPIETA